MIRIAISSALLATLISGWLVAVDGDRHGLTQPSGAGVMSEELISRGAAASQSPLDHPTGIHRRETQEPQRGPQFATVRGRCVDANTQAPIAQAHVRMWRLTPTPPPTDPQSSKRAWTQHESITSDAQGRFEFSVEASEWLTYRLHFNHQGYHSARTAQRTIRAGARDQVPDLQFSRTRLVLGLVRDREGRPVAGARLSFRYTGRDGGRSQSSWAKTEALRPISTDGRGRFALADPLQPGLWRIGVEGRDITGESAFRVPVRDARVYVSVNVKSLPINKDIRGLVVDALGKPVANAAVSIADRSSPECRTFTRADGSFRLKATQPLLEEYPSLKAQKEGYPEGRTQDIVIWGETQVRLVMAPRTPIEVVVRDSESGEPIEDFGIDCFEWNRQSSRFDQALDKFKAALIGPHQDGHLEIEGLSHETHWIRVRPTDPRYAPSEWFKIPRSGYGHRDYPRRIRLHASPKRTVCLTWPNGDPVVGSNISLLWSPTGMTIRPRTVAIRPESLHQMELSQVIRLASGLSDASGEAHFAIDPQQPFTVRVTGEGHSTLVYDSTNHWPGNTPLVIRVTPPGATLQGRLTLPTLPPQPDGETPNSKGTVSQAYRPVGVLLSKRKAPSKSVPVRAEFIPIKADGSFVIDDIPPGDWDLYLHYEQNLDDARGDRSRRIVASVIKDLKSSELRHIKIDGGYLRMGSIAGTVKINGKQPDIRHAYVRGIRQLPNGTYSLSGHEEVAVSYSGEFSASLLPGEYRISLEVFRDGKHQMIHGRQPFTVQPGKESWQDFDIELCSLSVQVLCSDGSPVLPSIRLSLGALHPGTALQTVTTDSNGIARFSNIAQGTWGIYCMPIELQDQGPLNQHMLAKGLRYTDAFLALKSVTLSKPVEKLTLTLPASAGF